MGRSLNRCQFIGNLGGDVELRYLPNGNAVANFSIGCDDSYKDKNTGQTVPRTDWIRIVSFGKLAEVCGEYLNKGDKVYVAGKMKTREYEKSGEKRYITEVHIDEMLMLSGKRDAADESSARRPPQQSAPRPQPAQQPPQDFDSFDDDIHF